MSLDQRLALLRDGTKRVAYFYEKPDNSTFRYRVYNMMQALEPHEGVSASYFCYADLARLEHFIDRFDVLVICRTRYDDRINMLISKVQSRGKRVLFDIDDLVFDPDYVHLVLETLAQDLRHPQAWDFWFAYVSRMGATLRLCDGAITSNPYLAQHIKDFADVPVAIVPNFMDREQLDISKRIFDQKRATNFVRDGRIHVGYFSGTPTHKRDFALVTSALQTLLETDDRVVIRIAGFMDSVPGLQRFKDRVEVVPFQDFVNLQSSVGQVELNVVPLQFNTFTNCKSELKYFEAAAVGTITVASPTFAYAAAIQDGKNGYLAQGHQWLEKLRGAIAELENYKQMAGAAAEHALANYNWQTQGPAVLRAVGV